MILEMKKKGKKVNFFDSNLWERWQHYWNTSEAKKIHETYSKNRMSKATGRAGPLTHTRVTATHYDHGRRLVSFIYLFFLYYFLSYGKMVLDFRSMLFLEFQVFVLLMLLVAA